MDIDSIIDKIKKAVRLARRTNSDGERETALRLAKNLASRHNLAFDEIAGDAAGESSGETIVSRDANEISCASGAILGFISYILKFHFGVIFFQTINRRQKGRMKCAWIGSKLNIDIARYVFHILLRESAKAWKGEKAQAMQKEGKEINRIDFMRGFFWAISKKLSEHPLRNDLDDAIMDAERKLLEYQQKNGAMKVQRNNSSKKKPSDVDALARGFSAGLTVALARPCETSFHPPHSLAGGENLLAAAN